MSDLEFQLEGLRTRVDGLASMQADIEDELVSTALAIKPNQTLDTVLSNWLQRHGSIRNGKLPYRDAEGNYPEGWSQLPKATEMFDIGRKRG